MQQEKDPNVEQPQPEAEPNNGGEGGDNGTEGEGAGDDDAGDSAGGDDS
jgi:hypothetical protein